MVISYSDELTHRAIIKTLKQLLDGLVPIGVDLLPPILLRKETGQPLSVIYDGNYDELAMRAQFKFSGNLKDLIEQNREF